MKDVTNGNFGTLTRYLPPDVITDLVDETMREFDTVDPLLQSYQNLES